jgi:pimeloyl-ACP methyl ester carboxylesterase
VPLAMTQELARYWGSGYDWRRCEAKLNTLPHFITEIDGLGIHFIHVRSKHEDALPLVINHGWPGSIIEQLKIIGPLADPTAHGASASDAFHVVISSMPGYGFPGEQYQAPRSWAERAYPNLIYYNQVGKGGHFAAWEQPQLFSGEVRAAFRTLR